MCNRVSTIIVDDTSGHNSACQSANQWYKKPIHVKSISGHNSACQSANQWYKKPIYVKSMSLSG